MTIKLPSLTLGFVNKKGFYLIFEILLVFLVFLVIIFGFIAFNFPKNDNYLNMSLKINDALIVYSKNLGFDNKKFYDFLFPKNDVELFVNKIHVFGHLNEKTSFCVIRSENILDENLKTYLLTLKYCE